MEVLARNEFNKSTNISKVKQYRWQLKDNPGQLMYLSKDMLLVDHSYQREGTSSRVLQIAHKWSYLACGVIVVAKRMDGCLYVVDGQHRVLAAMKRSDVQKLPCLVFETESIVQEAAAFFDANTSRRLPTRLEKWKAQLVCGDEITMFVDHLIRSAGREPSAREGIGKVRCLEALYRAAQFDRQTLVCIWPLIVEVCEEKTLHKQIVEGLFYLERRLPNGESLTKKWRDRVLRVGYSGLLDAAQRAASFYAIGGTKVWADGMLKALNKGCRIHIVLREED